MVDFKFDFDDVLIQPAIVTDVISRKDINPFQLGYLPLITAPMDTVINKDNEGEFIKNKIIPCQPRGIQSAYNGFTSYSLKQFQENFIDKKVDLFESAILIDMANGHMRELENAIITAKKMYGDNIVIMAGNVAHPMAYRMLSEAGADYVRVGIGNGGGCLTTQQLGIGYPMGSLIKECYDISCSLDNPAKIVADGGMKKFSDIIKALALGADYVMVGSIFNKTIESAGPCLTPHEKPSGTEWHELTLEQAHWRVARGEKIYKMFRGMSTKEVQKSWGAEELKTSEGVVRYQEVEYTLAGWVENFESYLRSAMSYTNSFTLDQFIGNVKVNIITQNAFNRFKK